MNRQQCSFANSICWILKVVALTAALLVAVVFAQNPVPQIVGPVTPMAVAPGSGPLKLRVFGANFVPGSVVNWNGKPRKTSFISAHELQAHILASDVSTNTAGLISVTNPHPGGGNSSSSWAQVEVHAPVSTINLKPYQPYPIGDWLLMAADFDHDGTLDLIGEYGSDLEFYRGKGDGTFQFESVAGRNYPGTLPAVYGDFNNDGNLDIAFAQSSAFQFQPPYEPIMLGDGHRKFRLGSRLRDW